MRFAFIGKMFSGKSTSADVLINEYGYRRLAFADPVKTIAARMLNTMIDALAEERGMFEVNHWSFDDIQARKGEPQVRQLLQLVGTGLGRELVGYEDIWVDLLVNSTKGLTNVVVDDCRFPNEAEALRQNDFRLVRVERKAEDRMDMMVSRYPANYQEILIHPSELALDSFEADITIYAEDVDSLQQQIRKLAQS